MNRITSWVMRISTGVLVSLMFVIGIVFMDNAFAQTLTEEVSPPEVSTPAATATSDSPALTEPVVQQIEPVVETPKSPFEPFITKTQLSFERALEDTNKTISDLAAQIEQASKETQPAALKPIKKQIGKIQDSVENVADTIDDLAESLQSFNKKIQSKVAANSELPKNVQNAQQSLENAAQSLNILADDTEKAKKNTSAAFLIQIQQEIQTVNQALEEASESIKNLAASPA